MNTNPQDAHFGRSLEESSHQQETRRQRSTEDSLPVHTPSYLFRLGRVPVELNPIEFRIMQFLSRRPYRAFRPEQIVQSVSREESAVTVETLRDHIRSLRSKLGIFSDYIQTVPHVGYRFKA